MEITPFENDTALAALFSEAKAQRHAINSATASLKAINRDGSPRYPEGSYTHEYSTRTLAEAQAKLAEVAAEMAPFEAEYAARRWSRFFLVTNGNGHVHSSMSCSTCYATTEFAWLPELSGKSEDEAVTEFGEKMCTVCFPSAPANPSFRGPGRRDREALDAKAAEKAAKLAAKLEKALLPDGSELRLQGWDRPKTLIAAQRALSSTLESLRWYGPTHPSAPTWVADIETLIDAISAKTGEAPESIRANVEAKVAKKIAKEQA